MELKRFSEGARPRGGSGDVREWLGPSTARPFTSTSPEVPLTLSLIVETQHRLSEPSEFFGDFCGILNVRTGSLPRFPGCFLASETAS